MSKEALDDTLQDAFKATPETPWTAAYSGLGRLTEPIIITPEDRARWLGLQLENARLQHEVERLEDELAALRLAQPVAAFLVEELPRVIERLKEPPHAG